MPFPIAKLRCQVFADKIGTAFTVASTASAPQAFRATAFQFEFAFFDSIGNLLDVGNITSLTLFAASGGLNYLTKTITPPTVHNITQENWDNGMDAHAIFAYSEADTVIAVGTYTLTLHAVISGQVVVLGTSTMVVSDSGIGGTSTPPDQTTVTAVFALVRTVLGDYLKKVNDPGITVTFTSEDGAAKRVLGITNDSVLGAQRYDDIEIP